MQASDLLTGPLALVSMVFGALAHLAGLVDPLVGALWATVPTWYPMLAISGSTIIPKLGTVTLPLVGSIEMVPLAQQATLVGALIYVGYLGDRLIDKINDNNEN